MGSAPPPLRATPPPTPPAGLRPRPLRPPPSPSLTPSAPARPMTRPAPVAWPPRLLLTRTMRKHFLIGRMNYPQADGKCIIYLQEHAEISSRCTLCAIIL